ncbi:multidrug effflux MFS transporter [Breoghania sp. JC706]|uniref:multidrug effflux MFS transporter n=1 Tax=Breoghania sp. JC706 TaxID=3117732 RepID=UPI00300AD942
MYRRPPLAVAIVLLSFPQFVETIYSPALPTIASTFHATPELAAQTLSCWFIAFALGVVVWGRLSDLLGRRRPLLAGLAIYALGSGWALIAPDFSQLLIARALSAFGAAVGSIVVQTALRDSYRGRELGHVFSLVGIALAISPAIGIFAGQEIADIAGHQGVFSALGILALALCGLSFALWPETRPEALKIERFWPTLRDMLADRDIWRDAILIATLNLAIFSYYQLGPFHVETFKETWIDFGKSGLLLAIASVLGALGNSALLRRGWSAERLIGLGIALLVLGAATVALFATYTAFALGMALTAGAYAIAIPNILSQALLKYADRLGTAGASLSMIYYILLGAGLTAAGYWQNLAHVLMAGAMLAAFMIAAIKRE